VIYVFHGRFTMRGDLTLNIKTDRVTENERGKRWAFAGEGKRKPPEAHRIKRGNGALVDVPSGHRSG